MVREENGYQERIKSALCMVAIPVCPGLSISVPCLSKRIEGETTAEVKFRVVTGKHKLLGEVCETCKQRYERERRL